MPSISLPSSRLKRLTKLRRIAELAKPKALPAGPSPIREPLDVVERFSAAWAVGDAAAIGELFTEDADFVNVVGLWWTSRLSIVRALERGFQAWFEGSTFEPEKLALRMLGEEAAVVEVRWRIEGQVDPKGEQAAARRGVATVVLRRLDDGTWLCVNWHNTDIAAAADTNLMVDGVVTPISYLSRPNEPDHPDS